MTPPGPPESRHRVDSVHPSAEVEAAYVRFLALLESSAAPPITEFIQTHPECDPQELRPYLEAICVVDRAAGSRSELPRFDSRDLQPEVEDGRYQVLGILGQGGMGIVFRVQDREMDREVAMKVIRHFHGAAGERMRRLFLTEVLTSAGLEHPSIVPVYDRGTTEDGRLYYTMRLVKGQTLEAVLSEIRKRVPQAAETWTHVRLLQVFYQLTLGVAYAHDRGIAHQDLKPANVMIGEFGEVQTLDWGLARLIGGVDEEQGEYWSLVGTPGYMAPEQIRGEAVDPRADVFALGAILYEVLTRRRPFPARESRQAIEQTLVGKYLDPRRHPAGDSLSDELVGIIDRALARQPECRYATAQELARDIFSYLEGARDLERKRQEADRQVARGLLFTQHWRRLRERLASAEAELTAGSEQVMPHWSLRRKAHLWQRRLRVERLRRGEGERFTRAAASFLRALGLYPEHRGARRNLVALHWEKLLEAESARDARAAAYHQQMVREYDDGTFAGAIRGQGRLRLQLHAPPAATSTVHVLLDRGPTLEEGMRVRDLGHGSISTTLELPMGPYVLRVARTGWPSLCFPFRVARQSNEAVHLIYPARGSDPLEEEFVVIPGARYELGGDPEVTDRPRREVELDDFLMARFPVTCAQYLAFLNDLVQLAPAVAGIRVPRMITGRPLWERAGPGRTYVLPERQVTPYAFATDHPVVAISWLDAHAYCEWRTLKDPESRTCFLPSPEEWEAAGRTADGRLFPWGNRYDPCLANNRESHKGRPCIMSVNSFPTDCSPFGVRGLAGNVAEWCAGYGSPGSRQLRIARGGHWNGGEEESRLARWQTYRADDVSPTLGFRICRMLHRRPSTQEVL